MWSTRWGLGVGEEEGIAAACEEGLEAGVLVAPPAERRSVAIKRQGGNLSESPSGRSKKRIFCKRDFHGGQEFPSPTLSLKKIHTRAHTQSQTHTQTHKPCGGSVVFFAVFH